MDETPDGIVLGEYGTVVRQHKRWRFWQTVAYIHVSEDGGRSWRRLDFLANEPRNKHAHLVRYSRHGRRILVTDGDNVKRSFWISARKTADQAHVEQGRFDSWFYGGGHTAFCETNEATFLGTDYHGGTNWIVCLRAEDGTATRRILPHPYRRYPVTNMHAVTDGGGAMVFASAVGGLSSRWRSLLFWSGDHGLTWNKLIDYDGIDVGVEILNGSEMRSAALVLSVSVASTNDRRIMIVRPRAGRADHSYPSARDVH